MEEISEEFGHIHCRRRNFILTGANRFRQFTALFFARLAQVSRLLLQLVTLALEDVALLRLPHLLCERHTLRQRLIAH